MLLDLRFLVPGREQTAGALIVFNGQIGQATISELHPKNLSIFSGFTVASDSKLVRESYSDCILEKTDSICGTSLNAKGWLSG